MATTPTPTLEERIASIARRLFQAGYESGKKSGLTMVIASEIVEPAAVKEILALYTEMTDELIDDGYAACDDLHPFDAYKGQDRLREMLRQRRDHQLKGGKI